MFEQMSFMAPTKEAELAPVWSQSQMAVDVPGGVGLDNTFHVTPRHNTPPLSVDADHILRHQFLMFSQEDSVNDAVVNL